MPPPPGSSLGAELPRHLVSALDGELPRRLVHWMERDGRAPKRLFAEARGDVQRELRFVVWSGLVLGAVLGLLTLPLLSLVQGDDPVPPIWFLPLSGVVVGYLTNRIALTAIFEPVHPRRVGPFTLHGLFVRRQTEVAAVYGRVIADDVVTLAAIGDELVAGPRSPRQLRCLDAVVALRVLYGRVGRLRVKARRDRCTRRQPLFHDEARPLHIL